jgi:hypothetical protein
LDRRRKITWDVPHRERKPQKAAQRDDEIRVARGEVWGSSL